MRGPPGWLRIKTRTAPAPHSEGALGVSNGHTTGATADAPSRSTRPVRPPSPASPPGRRAADACLPRAPASARYACPKISWRRPAQPSRALISPEAPAMRVRSAERHSARRTAGGDGASRLPHGRRASADTSGDHRAQAEQSGVYWCNRGHFVRRQPRRRRPRRTRSRREPETGGTA